MELTVFLIVVMATVILLVAASAFLVSMSGAGRKRLGHASLYSIKDFCRSREHHCWGCPLHVGKGCALAGPPCDWEEQHLAWRWPKKWEGVKSATTPPSNGMR